MGCQVFGSIRNDIHYGLHSDSQKTLDACRRCIELLEANPKPINQARLAIMSGYSRECINPVSHSLMVSLTYYDARVFECDNGSIGLRGVHDDV